MSNLLPISRMLPLLDVDLPKCPPVLILQNLMSVVREFCIETQAWTCELDRILVSEDVAEYDLEQPGYARIDTVKSVVWDGRVLRPLVDYVLPTKCSIRLLSVPTADTDDNEEDAGVEEDDGLFVEVVLVPWRDSTQCVVPAELYDDYQECWAAGTKARLMAMKKKPWTDVARVPKELKDFIEGKNAAKFEQHRAGTNAELTATVTPGYDFV